MKHKRLEHPKKGPAHVWVPQGYTSGLTIFVHGFNLGKSVKHYVDKAVEDFNLGGKFKASKTTSVCVAIASRTSRGARCPWLNLTDLISFLREEDIGVDGGIHVIGHSAAYINIAKFIKAENEIKMPTSMPLDHVSLLDATYGQFSVFTEFAKDQSHALDICVSKNSQTHKGAWSILKNLPGYFTSLGKVEQEVLARVLYAPQKRSHMSWVKEDDVIPALIRRRANIEDDLVHGFLP